MQVRRSLWAQEGTPNSPTQTSKPVSYNRAPNPNEAGELIDELKTRGNSPQLALVQSVVQFVELINSGKVLNINISIANLIDQLKSYQSHHTKEARGAFSYCISYLSIQLIGLSASNLHFAAYYKSCPLKEYLDSFNTNKQSPQKYNNSPVGSPPGSPNKG